MGLIKKRDTHLVKIENTKVNNYFKKRGFDYKVNSNNINKILIECLNKVNSISIEENSIQLKLFFEYVIENKIKINLNKKNEKEDYLINIVCRMGSNNELKLLSNMPIKIILF